LAPVDDAKFVTYCGKSVGSGVANAALDVLERVAVRELTQPER